MSKPIPSTTGVYKPGVGITITRANIALAQQRRAAEGKEPLTPAGIVLAFMPPNIQHPEEHKRLYDRYLVRASLLMDGKHWKKAKKVSA